MVNIFTDATTASAPTGVRVSPARRTYAEMQAEVQGRLGAERTDLATYIQVWLNRAQVELAQADCRWPDLDVYDRTTMDTAANGTTLALPTDVLRWHKVVLENDTSSYTLDYLTPRAFRDLYPEPGATGAASAPPCWYTYQAQRIYFAPMADAVYDAHLEYTKQPSAMSADADTAAITDSEPYLMHRATGWGYDHLGEHETAQYWHKQADVERVRLTGVAETRPDREMSGRYRGFGASGPTRLTHESPWQRR